MGRKDLALFRSFLTFLLTQKKKKILVKSGDRELFFVPIQHWHDETTRSCGSKFLIVKKEIKTKWEHVAPFYYWPVSVSYTHTQSRHSGELSVTSLTCSVLSKSYDVIIQPVSSLPSFRADWFMFHHQRLTAEPGVWGSHPKLTRLAFDKNQNFCPVWTLNKERDERRLWNPGNETTCRAFQISSCSQTWVQKGEPEKCHILWKCSVNAKCWMTDEIHWNS